MVGLTGVEVLGPHPAVLPTTESQTLSLGLPWPLKASEVRPAC